MEIETDYVVVVHDPKYGEDGYLEASFATHAEAMGEYLNICQDDDTVCVAVIKRTQEVLLSHGD